MSKVFISYSHDDEAFVRKLAADLEAQDISTWVDWRDIPAGYSWRQAIYEGILQSEYFLPVLSPSYLASELCRMEAYISRAHTIPSLPIMFRECYEATSQYPETQHFPDIFNLDYSGCSIYSITMTDEERLAHLVNVIHNGARPAENNVLYIAFPSAEYRYATKLWEDLNEHDIPAWISIKAYSVGEDWNKRHWDALRRSRVFVPILTVSAAQSFYMKKEVLLARTLKLPMLPLLTPEAASNDMAMRNLQQALDQSFEMRLLSEIQWLKPIPSYEAMLENLKLTTQKILGESAS